MVTKVADQDTKLYIGMTEDEFKTRFNNHKLSFKHKKHSTKIALSKNIWDLKENQHDYLIKWSILKHAKAYHSGSKICNLYITRFKFYT